jgi:hypothetical protein
MEPVTWPYIKAGLWYRPIIEIRTWRLQLTYITASLPFFQSEYVTADSIYGGSLPAGLVIWLLNLKVEAAEHSRLHLAFLRLQLRSPYYNPRHSPYRPASLFQIWASGTPIAAGAWLVLRSRPWSDYISSVVPALTWPFDGQVNVIWMDYEDRLAMGMLGQVLLLEIPHKGTDWVAYASCQAETTMGSRDND